MLKPARRVKVGDRIMFDSSDDNTVTGRVRARSGANAELEFDLEPDAMEPVLARIGAMLAKVPKMDGVTREPAPAPTVATPAPTVAPPAPTGASPAPSSGTEAEPLGDSPLNHKLFERKRRPMQNETIERFEPGTAWAPWTFGSLWTLRVTEGHIGPMGPMQHLCRARLQG